MKFLKIPLADGKVYTLSTLTMLEFNVMRKEHEKFVALEDESNKINFQVDENNKFKYNSNGGLVPNLDITKEQKIRLAEIEENIFSFGLSVIRKCIALKHKEFIITETQNEKDINNKLMGLIDISDLRKFVEFAFSGNYFKEETVIEIDLSLPEDLDDEKEKK